MKKMEVKQKQSEMKQDRLPHSVFIIFLVLIIDLLGFTVILPLFPSIFEYYRSHDDDHLYHWMDKQVHYFQSVFNSPEVFNKVLFGGLLGSIFSMLQFLVSPILGSLSDVYGRKPVLILSLVGIGVSHAVWCISDYFYLFIIARVIGGLSRGNISLCTAIVTDLCSEKTRGKGMALVGVAFGIGFLVGPMIGALFVSRVFELGEKFYVLPAMFAVVMSLLEILLVALFFEESLPEAKRATHVGHGLKQAYEFISPPSLFSFHPVRNMKSQDLKILKQIGWIYFVFLFIYSGLEYSLSFLTHIRFMFTSMQQGKMYFFSGIIMICVHGGYLRKVPPGKEIKTAILGAVLIIPSFIIIGLSRSILMFYVGLALYSFASAIVVPCLTTIVSKFGSSDQKGTVLGIFRSLGSLARAFGPFVFAVAYWSLTPTVSYCIGGLLLIIPLYLLLRLKKDLSAIVVKEE